MSMTDQKNEYTEQKMLVIDAIQNTLDITQSERGEVLQYLTALCNGCFHKYYYCWLGISRAGILSIIYTAGITLSTDSQQGELHTRLDRKLQCLVLIWIHLWIHPVLKAQDEHLNEHGRVIETVQKRGHE